MTYNYKNIGIILLITAVLLVSISIGAYLYTFSQNQLSTKLNDWAAFGSYIGGVIGGVITPLALVGAVLALFQQHNDSLKNKNQATAAEILKTIERVEDSIDKELKETSYTINYVGADHSVDCTAFSILTNPFLYKTEETIPSYSENQIEFAKKLYDDNTPPKEKLLLIESYGLISSTVGKLKFMKDLIEQHKIHSNSNFVAIFYKKKYKHAISRLIDRGYPIATWNNIDEFKNS